MTRCARGALLAASVGVALGLGCGDPGARSVAPPERPGSGVVEPAASPTPASLACAPQPTGLGPLLHPGALIVFGELHGTAESPAFVANAVCHAARTGREIAVGLEVPRDLQPQLDRFLDSGGQPDDVAALVQGEHWRSQDGNASKALLGVIEDVRALRHSGRKARVFFFDLTRTDGGERDPRMADNIAAQAERNAEGITLVLTGNLHAKTDSERWMSWHLARRHRDLVTLNIAHAGGSAYICLMGGECGIHTGLKGQDRGGAPFVERFATPDDGYGGMFYVGKVTPSPPAKHEGPIKVLQLPSR